MKKKKETTTGLESAKSELRVSDSTNCTRLVVTIIAALKYVSNIYLTDYVPHMTDAIEKCPLSEYNALNCLIPILNQFLIVQTFCI